MKYFPLRCNYLFLIIPSKIDTEIALVVATRGSFKETSSYYLSQGCHWSLSVPVKNVRKLLFSWGKKRDQWHEIG